MGGFARRMSYWNAYAKKFPARPLLRIDGGSLFETGTAESRRINPWMLEGQFRSHLDAVNLTAWDISTWQEMGDLSASGAFSREYLKIPLVSANVTPRRPNFPPVQKYVIKEYALEGQPGRRIGIGITGVLYDPEERISRTDFAVVDPLQALTKVLAELHSKTDYRIVLTDSDVGKAISLAVSLPAINLISVTHNYAAVSEPQQVGGTLVVIPVNEGRMLGEIRASVVRGTEQVDVQFRFVALDGNVPDDPALGALVHKAQAAVDELKKGKPPAQ